MNQQTLEYIYKKHEPEQYYSHFFQQKIRVDNRQFQQFRKIKLNLQKNKVALSQGQTIVLVEHMVKRQKVPYLGYETNLQRFAIRVHLTTSYQLNKLRKQKYLQNYLTEHIVDEELKKNYDFVTDTKNNSHYLQSGELNVRIVSEDGSLQQALILACSMALWCASIKNLQDTYNQKKLQLSNFLFPIKYCQLMKEILVDPTNQQEQLSTLEITFLWNILKNDKHARVIQKFKKNTDSVTNKVEVVNALQKLSKEHLGHIAIDLQKIKSQVQKSKQGICIEIEYK